MLDYLLRTIRILLICFVVIGVSSGQKPHAELFDEYDNITCEDVSARLDALISELGKRPDVTGYVVIAKDPNNLGRGGARERYIDGYARYRRFDEARLKVVRADEIGTRTRVWLVLPGAEFEVREVAYDMPAELRKLQLYSDVGDIGPCYTGPPLRLLAKYLKANPDTTANIAIGTPSAKSYAAERTNISNLFDKTYGVSSSRIRFFQVPGRFYSNSYELWIVSRKR